MSCLRVFNVCELGSAEPLCRDSCSSVRLVCLGLRSLVALLLMLCICSVCE